MFKRQAFFTRSQTQCMFNRPNSLYQLSEEKNDLDKHFQQQKMLFNGNWQQENFLLFIFSAFTEFFSKSKPFL